MKQFLKVISFTLTLVLGSLVFAQGGHDQPANSGHLKFKNELLHIHANFVAAPIVGEESILVLEAKDAKTHQSVELADDVEVVLWMPSMGHGSSPTQVEKAVDANGNLLVGVFNVKQIYFIMGGEWEVRVTLTDAQGLKETRSFLVKLDGGHGH